MKIKDVAARLCYYDTRNPDGVTTFLTKSEITDLGFTTKPKDNCYCDNCFYGRTLLAEYIFRIKRRIK